MEKINKIKILAKLSKFTGLTSLCYFLNRNRKRVMAYHNVIPDEYFDYSLHLEHSMRESSFKSQMNIISKRFSCDLDILNKKTVNITFDDGYYNQFKIASKILERNNIRAYFFCVANLINSSEALAMDKLQFWFSYVPSGTYILEEFKIVLNITDNLSRKVQWSKISKLLDGGESFAKIEASLDASYKFSSFRFINEEYYKLRFQGISSEELDIMKKFGHKIGAHSIRHFRLSTLKQEELFKEIQSCSDLTKNIYNTKIFCYPYGSYKDINKNVIEALKKHEFSHAFSYCNSPLPKEEKYYEYFMPRMFLPDTKDADVINFIVSGAKHFIRFRRLLPR